MLTKDDYQFGLKLKVRDYECDMQGIVNNSVYQNYMEHTRHEFILTMGLSFAELCEQDIIVVVARIAIAFKNSLHSNESFISTVSVKKEGVKYIFDQAIFNAESGQVIATAIVTAVAKVKGRLSHAAIIDEAIIKMEASQ